MKRILITGGAGFIGSRLALKLLKKGHQVTVLDLLSEQIHGADAISKSPLFLSIKDKVEFIQGDVQDEVCVREAIRDKDVVVHFAAETGTGQSMYQIKRYTDVNIGGTALLLELLAESPGVEKVVIASSRSIYGEGRYYAPEFDKYVYPKHRSKVDMEEGDFRVKYPGHKSALELVATDENSKIHPSSVYGITKQNQEQMVMTVCESIGIAPVAFRYQNVYGPGQSLSNPYTGILSIFSTLIRNNKGINVFEDGLESRDFVYIDDVVNATIKGIEDDRANGQIFNVGSGVNTSVMEVANTLKELYGVDVPVEISGMFRLGDIRHNFADTSKALKLIDFKPSVSFKEGISRFVDWVKTQELVETKYEESVREMREKGLLS